MFRVNAGFVGSDVGGASKFAAPPGGASSSAVGVVKALPPPDTLLISSSKANAGGKNEEGATEHNAPTVTTFATKSFPNDGVSTAASCVFPPLSEEEEE